jgi:integrase
VAFELRLESRVHPTLPNFAQTRARAPKTPTLIHAKRLVHYNEAALSENPKFIMPEFQTLTDEQAASFKAVIKGSRYEVLDLAGLDFGPRRGEIVGLAWEKFDWTNRLVIIDQQVQRFMGGAGLAITPTKGNKRLEWLRVACRVGDGRRWRGDRRRQPRRCPNNGVSQVAFSNS